MPFIKDCLYCYLTVLKRYAKFSGRARRQEFWCYHLVDFLVAFLLGIVDSIFVLLGGIPLLGGLYALGTVIPRFALYVRRMHDTGRSAWWLLLIFITTILSAPFILYLLDSFSPLGLVWFGVPALIPLSALIPLIVLMILILFTVQDSQPDENAYGPNPKLTPQPFVAGWTSEKQ